MHPSDELSLCLARSPEMHALPADAGNHAHAFGLGPRLTVPKETADVGGRFARLSIKPDQAIRRVTQASVEEVLVLSEQRDSSRAMEQGDNVWILNTVPGNVAADLPIRYPPLAQQRCLVEREVLVEKIQAASRRRPCLSSSARRASLTASATAASGMRPPHRSRQINSHECPSTTSSNTCHTMMRVPLNVGRP